MKQRFIRRMMAALAAGAFCFPALAEGPTALQEEIASSVDDSIPWGPLLNRECMINGAEAFQLKMQGQQIADADAEIARMEAELASPDLNPRVAPTFQMRLDRKIEQRSTLEDLTATSLGSGAVFGGMIDANLCRDRQQAVDVTVQACQEAGRITCACEGEAFADAWMSGDYPVNSQGHVRMNVISRTSCS